MSNILRSVALAALFVLGFSLVAAAAPVTVALLDMSAAGQGPGGNGAGMMGQGRGFGMMGGGFGRGMMGQGRGGAA